MIKINFLADGNHTRYDQSDIGTSNLFVDSFSDELVYCADNGTWFRWNGKHWEPDTMLKRNQFMKQLARYCVKFIFDNANGDQALLKYYCKLSDKNFRDKILKDAMSVNPIRAAVFDRHKFLFNCQNGTYNFSTGEFKKHDKKDMLTDMSNVVYDANATCPAFDKYILEVMEDDSEKTNYLLQIASYCLTGDTSRECFFVLYGDKTRNGKGTFVSTLTHLAGSYSKTLRPAAITRKQINSGASNASPEIAKLISSRLVSINEIEDGMMLDVALMKTLTGGDTMTARKLYQEEFEFIPQFKILINTNVLPRMTDDSIFKSDRIHILSFDRHFEVDERDTTLKDKLKTEIPGIFNRLVSHYKQFAKTGFHVPRSSQKIIQQYHLNSNNVMQYVEDNLYKNTAGYEKASDVYKNYTDWCVENGYQAAGNKVFKERASRVGLIYTEKCHKKNKNGVDENTYWVQGYTFDAPKTPLLDEIDTDLPF